MFALRINEHLGYKQSIIDIFSKDRFKRVLCLPHNGRKGDNPHFHLVIDCDYNQDALRKELKKYFAQGKGNAHMSIKVWDGNSKACSYLFKEETEPILRKGFTDEDLYNFKKQDEFIKETIEKGEPKKVVALIAQKCKGDDKWKHKDICFMFFDYYRSKGDWMPNKFQLERYVRAVQTVLCEEPSDWESMKLNWYNEMFNSRNF